MSTKREEKLKGYRQIPSLNNIHLIRPLGGQTNARVALHRYYWPYANRGGASKAIHNSEACRDSMQITQNLSHVRQIMI